MFLFKQTPLVLNIFDRNAKSHSVGREGAAWTFSCEAGQVCKLGANRVHVTGGQAASASGSPVFNDNGFTASLHIGVILYKQG
jgi:hypothetical protein